MAKAPRSSASGRRSGLATAVQTKRSKAGAKGAKSVFVPVVAVGASAGGLEALERLFNAMPIDSGLAFVIIQHLSPDFRSMMDELLARQSRMTIRHAGNGMKIEANTIYLNPPRQNLHITGNTLSLVAPLAGAVPNHPIDAFFVSLAAARGDAATGVILSGTGNDGTKGALAIMQAGGKVIVQEPGSAQFENMPRNAIEKGAASVTALPEDIPSVLIGSSQGEPVHPEMEPVSSNADPETAILRILDRRYGANFSYYKRSTVGRRMQRRSALSGLHDLSGYAQMLRDDPAEQDRLFADLLIGVTAFFRDRAAFDAIATHAVPRLAGLMGADRQLRIWVPGCASGEEAYSIGILLLEHARKHNLEVNAKIFATDLHAGSLDMAGAGLFPRTRLKELAEDVRSRYFDELGGNYMAKTELRRLIVFSKHNVLKDPPFTKLDLISCRNLLIYFDETAQRKVLSLFHFALVKGGILFLGPSETVGILEEEFEILDGRWRIFGKIRDISLPGATRMLPNQPAIDTAATHEGPVARRQRVAVSLRDRIDRRPLLHAYDALLARFAPPSLLLSRGGELLHIFGDAHEYLKLRSGAFSGAVTDVIVEPLRLAVGACLDEVRVAGGMSTIREVVYDAPAGPVTVHVRGEVLRASGIEADSILVTFGARPASLKLAADEKESVEQFGERRALHGKVDELQRQLRFTEESLQTTIEELETSNEELQSTNEELMSANEELQSTNEELHAVNEELYSITSEHQRKIEELTVLSHDMDHLFRCTDVGTVFLDKELRVRRFTPAAATAFHLLERDIGRPFQHISARFNYPELPRDLEQVAASAEIRERTVDIGDATLLLRIFPFRVGEATQGIVITLVDVTRLKQTERALEARNQELDRLIASLKQFTYIVSHDLRAPLRSISNSAKWIEEDLAEAASEEVRGHCQRLITYTRRLTAMLDDLREYARLDVADKSPVELDLKQLIGSIVESLDDGGRIKLAMHIREPTILCYRAPLSLVFQNLLDNALKYAGKDQVAVSVTVEDAGTSWRMSVADDGPGIPARHHDKIFLPFRKLTRHDDSKGTGMGLALVKKAVEDNGGAIEVASDPDQEAGSTFTFTWAKIAP